MSAGDDGGVNPVGHDLAGGGLASGDAPRERVSAEQKLAERPVGVGSEVPEDAGSSAVGTAAPPGAGLDLKLRRPVPKRRRFRRRLIEWAIILVVAVAVAVVVRTWVLESFFIPSGSMEPTLMIGDRILVNKLSVHSSRINDGEMVVFRRSPSMNVGSPNIKYLVKRVVAGPGQTIAVRGGRVWVNGKLQRESYLPAGTSSVCRMGMSVVYCSAAGYKVPRGDYFVMGDNRGDSDDSRYFGPVPGRLVVGTVWLRFWPLSRFKIF